MGSSVYINHRRDPKLESVESVGSKQINWWLDIVDTDLLYVYLSGHVP